MLPGGEVWCAFNNLGGAEARCIRAHVAGATGPVNVTVHEGNRCLGAWQAMAGLPAFIGLPAPGAYTLKWCLSGQVAQEKQVVVEGKPVDLILKDK